MAEHAVAAGTLSSAATFFALPASEVEPALAALSGRGGVLAMLVGIDGAFYRPLGSLMAFPTGGTPVGSLSSGCIEGDIALHAADVLASEKPRRLRYGRGSPFVDIRLPCGSGLDVVLVPVASGTQIDVPLAALRDRRLVRLRLPDLPDVEIRPEPRMVVIGTGPEAATFARLAETAGYPSERRDRLVLEEVDPETAVVLFFHDHERETDILDTALRSPAFWIGAQGSRTAQARRLEILRAAGWDDAAIARVHGPIGLIKGSRNPRVLAVSVLAEIVAAAQ